MGEISRLFIDPSWWFTAVFIAILASTAAGFLKDAIARVVSGMSESLRLRKKARDAEFKRQVDRIAGDSTLLILNTVRTEFRILGAAIFLTVYSSVGAVFISIAEVQSTRPSTITLLGLMTLAAAAAMFYSMWGLMSKIRLMNATRKEYNKMLREVRAQPTAAPDADEPSRR